MSTYYVVVDSEFRDRELYPLDTDFGVTFETRSSTGTYPQGQPVDPSQFFPRVTIDKNFDQQNIKIINGEILDIKVDQVTNKKYYAGVQRTNAVSNNFVILYNNEIIFSDVATITVDKDYINDYELFDIPFLFTLNENNKIEWIIIGYLSEPEFQTYQGYNKTVDTRLSINNSSQIIMLFDYKSNISFYKITTTDGIINTEYLNYNIVNPYGNGISALGIVAFDPSGVQLRVNNHPWGYGNIYTSGNVGIPCNMLPTNPEGRNSIISDKGNSIYVGANIDNINTSITNGRLDLLDESGSVVYQEQPVYYPENYRANETSSYKPAATPLAFTYVFTGASYPSDEFLYLIDRNLSLSRTFVVCNGFNTKTLVNSEEQYGQSTGTTIVAYELNQKNQVGRGGKTVNDNIYNVYPEVYERSLERVKYMNAVTGSSIPSTYNIPISAQNITTADFTYYSLSGTNKYIFSCNHCTGPTSTSANNQSFKVYQIINNTGVYQDFYPKNGQKQSGNLEFENRRMQFLEVANFHYSYLSTGTVSPPGPVAISYFEIYNISSVYNQNDQSVYFSLVASVNQNPTAPYDDNNQLGNKCILMKWNGTNLSYLTDVNPIDTKSSFFFSKCLYNSITNTIFVVTTPNYYTPVSNQGSYTMKGVMQIMAWNGTTLNTINVYSIFLDAQELNPRSITSFNVYQRSARNYYIVYTLNGVYTRIVEMVIQSSSSCYLVDVTSLFLQNGAINNLLWINEKTGHEYIIGSNVELSNYNINQYLNYTTTTLSGISGYINAEYVQIGKEATFGSQNGIFYISGNKQKESDMWIPDLGDLGDIYSVTRTSNELNTYSTSGAANYLNISWGSVLYAPSEIQIEHVNQVEKTDFKCLPFSNYQTEINDSGQSYYMVLGMTDVFITFNIDIYNITNLSNKQYIGNATYSYGDLSDVGYLRTFQTTNYQGYAFILAQQTFNDNIYTFQDGVGKVLYFNITNPSESYLQTIAYSDTSRRSCLVKNNGQLYIVEVYDDHSNGIVINVYMFDNDSFEFNLSPILTTTITDIDMRFISAIDVLDYNINMRKEICIVTTTQQLNYKLYFINFDTLETDFVFNSSILSCYYSSVLPLGNSSFPINANVCAISSVKNEIDKTYKVILQCCNPEIQDTNNVNSLQIISLPNNITNFNLETIQVQDEKIVAAIDDYLAESCLPRFSTIWNPVSKKQLLCIIETPTQYWTIYDITTDISNLVATINPALNLLSFGSDVDYYNPESIITFISNNKVYAATNTNFFILKYPELGYKVHENYISIFEITDEQFAQDYTLPTHTINSFNAQGKGYSALIKLQNDGSYLKANLFGDDNKTGARYDSQNVNIAGLTLANSDLSVFTSLSWRAKISILDNISEIGANTAITFTFDPPTSSITPTTFNGSINTTIAKTTTADMLIEYAIPIYGDLDTVPTNCQNAQDQIGLVVNTKSSTTYIYARQLRNVLTNPTVIQKILNNLSVQSSSACVFSQAGVINWTATLQTSEPNIITNTSFIDTTDSIFSMISTSNAKELQVINSQNQFQQSIYPFSGAENYIILTRFQNSNGTYLESDTFELHNLGKFTPSNFITSSGSNYMISSNTITPYEELTELNYRNKDGTLGDKSIQTLRNVYYEKMIYTSPGVYTFSVPTGCFAIYAKLWGAGGGCPADSFINGWNAFGGGGGYADKTLTYLPNTVLALKIGEASKGSQIESGTGYYESANGGDSSYLHSFNESLLKWKVEAVAGGGGGAGGFNGGNGGAAGRYGNVSKNSPPLDVNFFGVNIPQPGNLSGGGQGGGFGAQNGSSFQTYTDSYSSSLGTGGFAGIYYPGFFDVLGGGGGAGWGGGGAGFPGNTFPIIFDSTGGTGCAYGGAGGGSFGDRVVSSFTGSLEWTPANFLDEDYQLLSPDGYTYGAGGFPSINTTGTDGLGVIYFYYYDYSGATGAPNNIINLTSDYLYESSFVDKNGKLYSKLTVYKDSTSPDDLFTPYQTGDYLDMTNYYTYILGKNQVLNKNFSIRDNYYDSANNEFVITLNSKIDTTKLLRTFFDSPSNPNWQYFYPSNISKSSAYSILTWSTGPYPNSIEVLTSSSPIDPSNKYYILAPSLTGSIITIPVVEVQIEGDLTYLILDTLSMLQTDSIYIYLVEFNESALYNLQFYPGSIGATSTYQNLKFDVGETYFTVQLNRLIIPNRKIRTSPFGGLRDISDFPYIYLQMFNTTGAEGEPDKNLVNVTFTNNPNKNKPFKNPGVTDFMIPTQAGSDALLWMTLNSSLTPKIKFTPGSYTMRFRLCDPYGNTILFDNTPIKTLDAPFGNGVVDEKLMKIVYEITFKKI